MTTGIGSNVSSASSSIKPFNQSNPNNDLLDTTRSVQRMRRGAIGETGLIRYSGRIYDESQVDLLFPQSTETFRKMSYDATIAAARGIFGMMIRKTDIYAKPKEGQEENETAIRNAEFVNWQMHNFDQHSWREIINEVMTYDIYGFSLLEMIFESVNSGEYEGLIRVKDLSPRAQYSVNRWIWNEDGRRLRGFRQILASFNSRYTVAGYLNGRSYINIPIQKCLLFSYGSTLDNPQGNSPLKNCYITWQLKCLIEEYEGTGIAKDMSGMPVFGIDQDILTKARQDPESSEAILFNYLEQAGANMHAGEQNFLVQPLAYDSTGKPLFTFELKGVDGGNKNYDVDTVIRRRQNEILMAYFADVLKLGQDGTGSFALADSKNGLLAHAVQDHLHFITEVFNKQFIGTLAKLNGWEEEEIPTIVYDDVEDRDLDELSKFLQRTIPTGAISTDQDLDAELRKIANLPAPNYEAPIPMENQNNNSRAGDGMNTTGDGTADAPSNRDNSVANNENA